jgi:hypothetical protein
MGGIDTKGARLAAEADCQMHRGLSGLALFMVAGSSSSVASHQTDSTIWTLRKPSAPAH